MYFCQWESVDAKSIIETKKDSYSLKSISPSIKVLFLNATLLINFLGCMMIILGGDINIVYHRNDKVLCIKGEKE
jgi:hypothetical protein